MLLMVAGPRRMGRIKAEPLMQRVPRQSLGTGITKPLRLTLEGRLRPDSSIKRKQIFEKTAAIAKIACGKLLSFSKPNQSLHLAGCGVVFGVNHSTKADSGHWNMVSFTNIGRTTDWLLKKKYSRLTGRRDRTCHAPQRYR